MRRLVIIGARSLFWTAMLVILAHAFIPHHHDIELTTRHHHQEAKHPEQQPGHHNCTFHVNPLVPETQKEYLPHLFQDHPGLYRTTNPVLSISGYLPVPTNYLLTHLPLDHRWFEIHPPFLPYDPFESPSLRAPPANC